MHILYKYKTDKLTLCWGVSDLTERRRRRKTKLHWTGLDYIIWCGFEMQIMLSISIITINLPHPLDTARYSAAVGRSVPEKIPTCQQAGQ